MMQKISAGEIRFNEGETGIIRRTYLLEQKKLPPSTLWEVNERNLWVNLKETGHTRQAKYEQKKLFPQFPTSKLFRTPKPEKVIQKIISISTYENEYVLDFFGGSGTTASVALKMGRRFITCEQMDYIEKFVVERIKKVLDGEQGGISKSVNWLGGGNFIYCELMKYNQVFIERIQSAQSSAELLAIWKDMSENSFLNWYINPNMPEDAIRDFETIGNEENGVEKQKHLLMELLDKNQLYVNLSEIDDAKFNVSEEDKALNKAFYRD